jgi:hypothetical protein
MGVDGSTAITPLRFLALLLVASGVVLATACIGSNAMSHGSRTRHPATATSASPTACSTPRVQYGPYPGHGQGLSQIPWVRGEPPDAELVALLWYWPQAWTRRHLREARIFTGGVAPAGYNVKILWTFLAPLARSRAGRNLVVQGHQLNGSATSRQRPFSRIGYGGEGGAPSYASIINIPHPGCWRLDLKSRGLSGYIQFRAVSGRG